MSLANKFRWFPTPGYGRCGGADLDCADLDPMDVLFYQHDCALHMARTQDQVKEADQRLYEGLKAISKKDFDKIPFLKKSPPFFQRWYAQVYRWGALKAFKP